MRPTHGRPGGMPFQRVYHLRSRSSADPLSWCVPGVLWGPLGARQGGGWPEDRKKGGAALEKAYRVALVSPAVQARPCPSWYRLRGCRPGRKPGPGSRGFFRRCLPGIEVRTSSIPFLSCQACDRMGAHAITGPFVPAIVKARKYPGQESGQAKVRQQPQQKALSGC